VFFIEVKPYVHLQSPRRDHTDKQMRRIFRDLVVGSLTLAIPRLYEVSAMGTCLSLYEYKKATGVPLPPAIVPDPTIVNDVAPGECWNYELLEAIGEENFRAIVADVATSATIALKLLRPWPIIS
jgi:hypothetical protein